MRFYLPNVLLAVYKWSVYILLHPAAVPLSLNVLLARCLVQHEPRRGAPNISSHHSWHGCEFFRSAEVGREGFGVAELRCSRSIAVNWLVIPLERQLFYKYY